MFKLTDIGQNTIKLQELKQRYIQCHMLIRCVGMAHKLHLINGILGVCWGPVMWAKS